MAFVSGVDVVYLVSFKPIAETVFYQLHRLRVHPFVVYRGAVVDGLYRNDQEAPVSSVILEELHVVGASDERCPAWIQLCLGVIHFPDGDVFLPDDSF